MRKLPVLAATVLAASALSGCAEQPMGPMVQVLPKPGKPYATFVSEQNFCEQQAGGAVAGQASSANQRAVVGGLLATAAGAALGGAIGGGYGAGIGAASGAGLGLGVGSSYSGGHQGAIQRQYDTVYLQCMVSYGNVPPQPVIVQPAPVVVQPSPYYAPY
jgi:uncharacterized protein YcfJ